MARPGRKPIPPLLKARRAAAVAINDRNELHAQIKAERANPAAPQPRKIGKQPVPITEKWRRSKEIANQSIAALRELERAAGEKSWSENALLRWLKDSDYSAGAGHPGLGKLGELFKELRRKSAMLHKIADTPVAAYDLRYKEWLNATGKKGRQPQTRQQRLQELKFQIRVLETQIDDMRATLDPGNNMKVELDQLRIRRRNLTFRINNQIGIRSTDADAKPRQQAFLKSPKGRRLRQATIELDIRITELAAKIQVNYPNVLKTSPSLTEAQSELHAVMSTLTMLIQNVDSKIQKLALKQLKKEAETSPQLLAALKNLQITTEKNLL